MTQWIESELATMRYWIAEREAIRKAKEGGLPKPWTTDPLLRDFRWCNVRRMDDRVSRELFERWYPRHSTWRGVDLTRALFARLINWPEALDEVAGSLDAARVILLARAERGDKVFTAHSDEIGHRIRDKSAGDSEGNRPPRRAVLAGRVDYAVAGAQRATDRVPRLRMESPSSASG